MSPFDDETPLDELLAEVIDLADDVVDARLAGGEPARRRDLIMREDPLSTRRARAEQFEDMALYQAAEKVAAARREAEAKVAAAQEEAAKKVAAAQQEAVKKVAAARQEAGRILADARRESASIVREAHVPAARTRNVRHRSLVLLAAVLVGLASTGLAVATARQTGESRMRQSLAQRTEMVAQGVAAEVSRYSSALTDIAAAVGAQADLEAKEFTAITAPIGWTGWTAASGVSFVVATDSAQISQVQARWRANGATDLVLRPAAPSGEHLFAVLSVSATHGPASGGLDLTAASEPAEALRLARDTHSVVASRPYRLLRDRGLPPAQQQLSTVLAAPVYTKSTPRPELEQFRGWVTLSLRFGDLLTESTSETARDVVAVSLRDTTAGNQEVLAAWQPPSELEEPTAMLVTVEAAQRQWQLQVAATDRLQPSSRSLDLAAWLVGVVITALLSALALALTGTRRAAVPRAKSDPVAAEPRHQHREDAPDLGPPPRSGKAPALTTRKTK
ncbi:CHASE domain-containing protein [Actinoplanes sp. TRM 88003]|uniref:CHASE domain-containing protein n=1 Tax=Paractinoplanes aksuensis TaxID=2939490 RepID=A0ABT1DEX8_9ACTN|nr:CHASE domain-containing protein [Actinoplanes aksuensis]MCO8269382.1 CHASE domain-containing protein [Actinoplanes aksuensis]